VNGGMTHVPALRVAESRAAWRFMAPALGALAFVAIGPIVWTAWESLHLHDLRMPWLGHPFIGLDNYQEALASPRVIAAAAHTGVFVVLTVTLEVIGGLVLALVLHQQKRARGLVRAAALLPWALPTVVVALLWRFAFEGPGSVANVALARIGFVDAPVGWLSGSVTAWIPIVLADAWRMTPFVALLILAGLQQIDPALYEAARLDGASPWQAFRAITLPLVAPALLVAALFRALDAVRVFDLVYVLTAGGPGTATEPLSVYAFDALMRHLRFGYGSAISMGIFLASFASALAWIRLLGHRALPREEEAS
jgi:ABC-type sugar transport system permease subunit